MIKKKIHIILLLMTLFFMTGCFWEPPAVGFSTIKEPLDVNNINDFKFDIALGNIEGYTTEFKFARSSLITNVETVLWDAGGNYVFLESAEPLSIVSNSVLDTIGGSGANLIIIYGLDKDYIEINEIILMNGTIPVISTLEYLRTYRMLVYTSGTNDPINDANQGIITATSVNTTTLQAQMGIHNGQTLMSVYTIPANKTGLITGVSFSSGQGKQCLFKAKFRNGPTSENAFSVKYTLDLYENALSTILNTPLVVPEKTDILITVQTTSGTIDASASYGLILIEN